VLKTRGVNPCSDPEWSLLGAPLARRCVLMHRRYWAPRVWQWPSRSSLVEVSSGPDWMSPNSRRGEARIRDLFVVSARAGGNSSRPYRQLKARRLRARRSTVYCFEISRGCADDWTPGAPPQAPAAARPLARSAATAQRPTCAAGGPTRKAGRRRPQSIPGPPLKQVPPSRQALETRRNASISTLSAATPAGPCRHWTPCRAPNGKCKPEPKPR